MTDKTNAFTVEIEAGKLCSPELIKNKFIETLPYDLHKVLC